MGTPRNQRIGTGSHDIQDQQMNTQTVELDQGGGPPGHTGRAVLCDTLSKSVQVQILLRYW